VEEEEEEGRVPEDWNNLSDRRRRFLWKRMSRRLWRKKMMMTKRRFRSSSRIFSDQFSIWRHFERVVPSDGSSGS